MKRILVILLVIGFGIGIWYFLGRDEAGMKEEMPQEETQSDLSGIEQKVLAFSIDGRSSKGARQWHLEGNSAEIIEEDVHLNDLEAVVYGDEVTVDLTSDRGIYRKEAGEVELLGNVEVVASDGTILKTDTAKWSHISKEISTEDFVHIEREGMIANGTGAIANSDERTASLKKDVEVIIPPDTTVTCAGALQVNSATNTATFEDRVKVVDKDGKLFADKLTVHFDPDTKKLAEVVAEGNVKVRKGNSYTISERAVYSDTTKSAKLEGRPRIIIDPAELEALDNM